jgi:hypothetical protein
MSIEKSEIQHKTWINRKYTVQLLAISIRNVKQGMEIEYQNSVGLEATVASLPTTTTCSSSLELHGANQNEKFKARVSLAFQSLMEETIVAWKHRLVSLLNAEELGEALNPRKKCHGHSCRCYNPQQKLST